MVRLGAWDDPERLAFNASRGLSPYTDLVEALVEQRLDAGEVRDEARAFAHAYADRSGHAYREITLYDAWSSGTEIEMPDVECLGMLHDLEDDWHSFVAPVPGRKQRPLYDRLGSTTRSSASTGPSGRPGAHLSGAEPVLPGSYGPSVLRLTASGSSRAATPSAWARTCPPPRAGAPGSRSARPRRTTTRRWWPARGRAWRACGPPGSNPPHLARDLQEYGAFDPKPPVTAPPTDGDGSPGGEGSAARDPTAERPAPPATDSRRRAGRPWLAETPACSQAPEPPRAPPALERGQGTDRSVRRLASQGLARELSRGEGSLEGESADGPVQVGSSPITKSPGRRFTAMVRGFTSLGESPRRHLRLVPAGRPVDGDLEALHGLHHP